MVLKFNGKGGDGKIKVKPNYDKIPLHADTHLPIYQQKMINLKGSTEKATKSFADFHNESVKLNSSINNLKTKSLNNNYDIVNTLIGGERWIKIRRISDGLQFTIRRNVTKYYVPEYMRYSFIMQYYTENQLPVQINIDVNDEIMIKESKENPLWLKKVILQQFSNHLSDNINIDQYEAEVILGNVMNIPGFPEPSFNGTLYQTGNNSYVGSAKLPEFKMVFEDQAFSQGGAVSTSNTGTDVSQISKSLPGMNEKLICPEPNCACTNKKTTLWKLVQHLNDDCDWTRERIADWLDSLADDGIINIDFQPYEDIKSEDNDTEEKVGFNQIEIEPWVVADIKFPEINDNMTMAEIEDISKQIPVLMNNFTVKQIKNIQESIDILGKEGITLDDMIKHINLIIKEYNNEN